MKPFEAIQVLNHLLNILCRSLSAYLADARPWAKSDLRPLQASFDRLVADQRLYAKRVSNALAQRGGYPDLAGFPTEFTSKNDLALKFLLQNVLEYMKQDMASIEHCAAELEGEPPLHALAEEILGNLKGHYDILKEQMKQGLGIGG